MNRIPTRTAPTLIRTALDSRGGRVSHLMTMRALVNSKAARLASEFLSPPKDYPCPNCRAAKRLRGAHAFASVTCAECGTAWRPREEIGGYRLRELLARSGFALIFRAADPLGGQALAVKVFGLPSGSVPEDAERFNAAVKNLEAYEHPNWLNVFGGGTEEDVAWLAMEWLPAGSLSQRGQMGEADALRAAVQIADALTAAHECGLDHRNLQIGECLLADAQTVKVSGFAEAIFYERAGHDVGTVPGRLACVPPERVFGDAEDSRSEIYALGAILFQMLTGELPYAGETVPEFFLDRLDDPPPRLADSVGTIRKSTAALVERMMAIDPGERFSSWNEVGAVLRNELGALSQSGSPATALQAPVHVPAARRVAKAPAYSAAGGAWFTILMLAGIAGFAGWFGWKHFQAPAPKTTAIFTPMPTPVPAAVPAATPAPVAPVAMPDTPSPVPQKPAAPKMDWSDWKKFILESPKRPGTGTGESNLIPGSGALRLKGNNSGMAGGHDENVFYARQIEGNWTLTVRVSSNDGPAGIVARESIGSERPCVGLTLDVDGRLNSLLRQEAAARLLPVPVAAPAGSRWLRIVRRGTAMSAFHSTDGKHWREAVPLNLPTLPPSVPAGFVVWSGVREKEAGATFEDVSLTSDK